MGDMASVVERGGLSARPHLLFGVFIIEKRQHLVVTGCSHLGIMLFGFCQCVGMCGSSVKLVGHMRAFL